MVLIWLTWSCDDRKNTHDYRVYYSIGYDVKRNVIPRDPDTPQSSFNPRSYCGAIGGSPELP
jgi:hypothetical protein